MISKTIKHSRPPGLSREGSPQLTHRTAELNTRCESFEV